MAGLVLETMAHLSRKLTKIPRLPVTLVWLDSRHTSSSSAQCSTRSKCVILHCFASFVYLSFLPNYGVRLARKYREPNSSYECQVTSCRGHRSLRILPIHTVCAEPKGEEGELDFDIILVRRTIWFSPVEILGHLNYSAYWGITILPVYMRLLRLAFILKPSGKLLVTDMTPNDSSFHTSTEFKDAAHTVSHNHGFTENGMEVDFESAEWTLIWNVALAVSGK
jgi:hypothetical protein